VRRLVIAGLVLAGVFSQVSAARTPDPSKLVLRPVDLPAGYRLKVLMLDLAGTQQHRVAIALR
jgi:hypothetical protein